MATRFYLPSSGSPPVTPPTLTGWTAGTTAHFAAPTGTTKSNTSLTDFLVSETLAANFNVPVAAYVSDALAGQSISGTISAVIGCYETLSGADDSLQVGAYLIAGDGSSIKQTLYGGHTAALQTPTTTGALGQEMDSAPAETRIIPSTAITGQTADSGDRLMIVVGYRAHGISTGTLRGATLRLGDPTGAADFALTSDLLTDLAPWVELSADLTFDAGEPDPETAALDAALPALTGAFTADAQADAAMTATLPAATGSFTAAASADGTLTGVLPLPLAALTAVAEGAASATLAAVLPALVGQWTAGSHSTATLAGTIPSIVGSFTAGEPETAPVLAAINAAVAAVRTADPSVNAVRASAAAATAANTQTSGVS